MHLSKTKIIVVATIILILAIPQIQVSRASGPAASTAKEKLPAFLSQVIGIDLSKYEVASEGYSTSYPSDYGGFVKQEVMSFNLTSSSSQIYGMCILDNGLVAGIVFRPTLGSLIYSQQPSTNALDEIKNIVTRYQTFAQNFGIATLHLTPALSMLNSVTELKSSNTTLDNMKMEISCTAHIVANLTTERTKIAWVYTANGIDAPKKCVSIAFSGNQITFIDTWNLYEVDTDGISEAEAEGIAWKTAKSYNLTIVKEDKTIISVKPDWTNMTSDIALNMVPGQTYNNSLNEILNFGSAGNKIRNPLTLYPLWQTIFYFSEPIGGAVGVQVGVWGDTKEIAYCSSYGFHDGPAQNPSTQPQPANSLNNSLLIAALVAFVVVIAVITGKCVAKRKI
ncbi:MAG: hypothetical protein NWF05_03125 [Candidatus Bathyarchaeota archaeon]|nr:hypothetical protein [Candidatus Bathyarchaeota archaeon]